MSGTNAFQVRETDIEFLRGRWNSLSGKFTDDEVKRDDAFSSIVQQYSGPDRVYHNLSHIKALITLYEEVKNQGGSDAVSFAVWYHDIVYDTHKSDNEENSARLARDGLSRMGAPADTIADVEKMILATKRHSAEGLTDVGKLFLDLDLSILGSPPELYGEYSRAIRQESDWVLWPIYREARGKILRGFLQREVFLTSQMRARFEDQARRNVEHELKELTD